NCPVQADLAQRRDEALDGDAVIGRGTLLQGRAMLPACFLDEVVEAGEEGPLVVDLEDDGQIGAFAQIRIAAGDGRALEQQRTDASTEESVAQTELLGVALA